MTTGTTQGRDTLPLGDEPVERPTGNGGQVSIITVKYSNGTVVKYEVLSDIKPGARRWHQGTGRRQRRWVQLQGDGEGEADRAEQPDHRPLTTDEKRQTTATVF